uniref:C-type lectin domain-containing protein n=1 Tax=Fundulus heteroclitus TaxID=8078 RepID=A0A3Q2PS13_FUNHE
MQHLFTCSLLLLSLFGVSAKYAYVKEAKTWFEAQQYCLQEYAGLAPISNQQDIVKMMKLVGRDGVLTWTGTEVSNKVMFWGGGIVSGFFKAPDESTDTPEASSGSVPDNMYDFFQKRAPFFCYKPVVVREKKSWEDAWNYCREHHNMLASVASEAEVQLMQRELSKFPTTERVWIGLHFFPRDGWLWKISLNVDLIFLATQDFNGCCLLCNMTASCIFSYVSLFMHFQLVKMK